uniref:Phosphotransferase n=1 Tax=Meloidogyne enterolobii TaxID=390850 RepID=A0A6V7X6H9_MELEN|nr:unnamed protein product [Meloidogyne enterolobii]
MDYPTEQQLPVEVRDIVKKFRVPVDRLKVISDDMVAAMKRGLESGSGRQSSIGMLPSFVPALPDGTEIGNYCAIDLSGKNCRILLVVFEGPGHEPVKDIQNFVVPKQVMTGTGEQLFNFIINSLKKVLRDAKVEDQTFHIGFVFSFPCELTSIREARLLWWTKGYNIPDCLQKDMVTLLDDALELSMTVKGRVKAIMNDTVGQLAASHAKYGDECIAACVIGYGCNSAYLEDVKNIKKFDPEEFNYRHEKMVVVTEWEEFGRRKEMDDIMTEFDRELDAASVHVGKQVIDKLTGALYLGELIRRILLKLTKDKILFCGEKVEALEKVDGFPAKYISEIFSEPGEMRKNCRKICDEMEVQNHGSIDYFIMQEVCIAASERSAGVVAAAISALLRHIGRRKIKIGLGGAIIQFHPQYQEMLENYLKSMAPINIDWELCIVEEGSVLGAALVAAIAVNMNLK